jgi:hypothetical protein
VSGVCTFALLPNCTCELLDVRVSAPPSYLTKRQTESFLDAVGEQGNGLLQRVRAHAAASGDVVLWACGAPRMRIVRVWLEN